MPTGSLVDSCYQKLKLSHGDEHAARICQHATGQALMTGKPPKKGMSWSQRTNARDRSLDKTRLTSDERSVSPQLLTPPECKGCKHRNVDVFENTPRTIGAGA
jgi:hypothetical protein